MMLLRLITWPYVRKHLLRSVLTTGGIVLGVALVVGMHTANRSVLQAFNDTGGSGDLPPHFKFNVLGSATVLTLGAHMCKWPIGDPASDSFTFCGRRIGEGSYCVEHARVAYQPKQKGKRSSAAELARSLRRDI